MKSKLVQSLSNILKLNAKLVDQKAKRLGSPEYQILDTNMKVVVEAIQESIPIVHRYDLRVGKGNGYLARVPWIYISKLPGPVSAKVGVAICFCRRGNGIILGKMHPMGIVDNQKHRLARKMEPNFIDVNGDSYTTKYNDRFVNPFEVLETEIESNTFLSQLESRVRAL